ncbi:MAG: TRAP transporter substrate-binding protein [Clostridiales bacterium]
MKRKISIFLVMCMIVTVFAGCGNSNVSPSDTSNKEATDAVIKLKIGHVLNSDSPFHAGALHFAELIEEKSGGMLQAEVFPSALLGNDRELAEGLQLGTVDMAVTATAPVSGFSPTLQVFDLPFLFNDAEHAYKVLDGELGDQILDEFHEASGIVGLAFWENGFRHFTNGKRPIKTADDTKGLKIRVQEISSHIDYWKNIGCSPTPMAWTEVYTALQQGTVDGQENPVQTIYTQKIYEVQKYISLTYHCYAPAIIMISQNAYDKLSPEHQVIVKEAAREAAAFERNFIYELESGAIDEMSALGVDIVKPEDIDIESFRAAAAPIHQKYGDLLGVTELLEKIKAAD